MVWKETVAVVQEGDDKDMERGEQIQKTFRRQALVGVAQALARQPMHQQSCRFDP